ncbi:hypothetical protein FHETE_7109 [Fusarium heterosporum]|uniref:Transcription factor domain-containing protein n=1 Tax=Fusarium heterosporum TaxID=42747 RepID=A0A8H5WIU6_FUSHE|nr:hypothetical protein FHETE_7109 [Fusarium heterosporum]
MATRTGDQAGRSRRACEPCRKSTKDRVRNLESQVASLSELLRTYAGNTPIDGRLQLTTSTSGRDASPPIAMDATEPQAMTFSDNLLNPPRDVLAHFVEIYSSTIHLQPLALFEPHNLGTLLDSAPLYLLHSFLAIMLDFSTHIFYGNKHSEAAAYYTHSAVSTTQQLASEGKPRVEIVQSLCLLALKDIRGGKLTRAWMSIGNAVRLQSIHVLQPRLAASDDEKDNNDRCSWSTSMIEAAFFPHMPRVPDSDMTRKYPPSAEPPPSIPLDASEVNALDFDNAVGAREDLGINTHAGRMISVWGQVANHLHQIKMGEVQIPWLPESTYSKLNLTLFEYEAQFHQRHLMRNLFPFKRMPDEIRAYRQYWNPWLTTHLVLHASLALLNHPFVHLVALRHNKGARWVFWLIGIFEDLSVDISNPLIGLAVAATSTIPWLYQFVRNLKVARKASQNLAKGQRCLERLSKVWPCISSKLESLKRLQSLVIGTSPQADKTDTTINFPPSMIWELLDPIIQEAGLLNESQHALAESQPYVSIHVTTDFLHPLADDDAEPSPVNWDDNLLYGNDFLHDLYPVSLVPFEFQ